MKYELQFYALGIEQWVKHSKYISEYEAKKALERIEPNYSPIFRWRIVNCDKID